MKNLSNNTPAIPTDTKFGYTFSCIFFIVSLFYLYLNSINIAIFLFFCAVMFGIVSALKPDLLRSLNLLWFRLGLLLGKIVSPLVLSSIYFLLLSPIAILMRAFGRDILSIKVRKSNTYWVTRNELSKTSFKDQF